MKLYIKFKQLRFVSPWLNLFSLSSNLPEHIGNRVLGRAKNDERYFVFELRNLETPNQCTFPSTFYDAAKLMSAYNFFTCVFDFLSYP